MKLDPEVLFLIPSRHQIQRTLRPRKLQKQKNFKMVATSSARQYEKLNFSFTECHKDQPSKFPASDTRYGSDFWRHDICLHNAAIGISLSHFGVSDERLCVTGAPANAVGRISGIAKAPEIYDRSKVPIFPQQPSKTRGALNRHTQNHRSGRKKKPATYHKEKGDNATHFQWSGHSICRKVFKRWTNPTPRLRQPGPHHRHKHEACFFLYIFPSRNYQGLAVQRGTTQEESRTTRPEASRHSSWPKVWRPAAPFQVALTPGWPP
ncbi:hypothetical protein LSM04_006510 [Trypanosoma melophagium]|uniref:uncharacterized protein n=1 Tax=Trypanosoma melophagium TaxID=715481 RepID=UPI00351A0F89|nr:hypothetical protein LSM04_006510 [Trypanosoma melophagium]